MSNLRKDPGRNFLQANPAYYSLAFLYYKFNIVTFKIDVRKTKTQLILTVLLCNTKGYIVGYPAHS